jgi:hypothetical protein
VTRSPTPLQWPEGWPRTPADQRANLLRQTSPIFQSARALIAAIQLLMPRTIGGSRPVPVITSDLPVGRDGLPVMGGRADDPGVAVYWHWRGIEHMIACDRWTSAADNLRALAKIAGLLRGLRDWAPEPLVAAILVDLADCEIDRYPLVAALADLHGGT